MSISSTAASPRGIAAPGQSVRKSSRAEFGAWVRRASAFPRPSTRVPSRRISIEGSGRCSLPAVQEAPGAAAGAIGMATEAPSRIAWATACARPVRASAAQLVSAACAKCQARRRPCLATSAAPQTGQTQPHAAPRGTAATAWMHPSRRPKVSRALPCESNAAV